MKVYEKPKLMVLSVSADDMLCACTVGTRNPTDSVIIKLNEIYGGSNGFLDPSDNVFGNGEEGCSYPVDVYCKHTPEGFNVFTS